MKTLRPYQSECLDAVVDAKRRGVSRALYVLPTGTGKTITFCNLIQRLRQPDRPALVLAHREELLQQASLNIQEAMPFDMIGTEKAASHAGEFSDVVVASIQTLAKKDSTRLDWLARRGPSVIIYDEAHHAASEGAQDVLERFGAFDKRTFLVGCTATPKRLDRKALSGRRGAIFEEQVYTYTILDAMRQGFLCPIRGYRVITKTDLSGVAKSGDDFNQAALAKAVDNQARTQAALKHWKEVAADRPTIIFCCSVEHAEHAATAWREAGVKAACIHGGLDGKERARLLEDFKNNRTQVMTNCGVLTEGFDYPAISCVVMLRPTQSWSLYMQMAGRGTRLHAGKEDLIVLDVVDNCQKHTLATAPAILDLPARLDLQGKLLTEAADKMEEMADRCALLQDYEPSSFSDLVSKLQSVDLFANLRPQPEVLAVSRFNWLLNPQGYYLTAGQDRDGNSQFARISMDALYHWQLKLSTGKVFPVGNGERPDFPMADRYIQQHFPAATGLLFHSAAWRQEAVTDKQRGLLLKKGYKPDQIARMTKGDASGLISQLLASR